VTTVLIDSNVILDILTRDKDWYVWSAEQVREAVDRGRAVINPVIYAEISARIASMEVLDQALAAPPIEREPLPFPAAFLAGKVFAAYRRRGGRRGSFLSDFLIGAHASVAAYTLLTRDPRPYRRDFPKLRLIAPD
jgi:predicted nucleic acid-binding protein